MDDELGGAATQARRAAVGEEPAWVSPLSHLGGRLGHRAAPSLPLGGAFSAAHSRRHVPPHLGRQVRLVMGKEPLEFVSLFEGRMIVHAGGGKSGFRNSTERDSYDTDGVALYHVRGTADDTRAVQVAEVAGSLTSADCFVLLVPAACYVWTGRGSNQAERQVAQQVADTLRGRRSAVDTAEGREPKEFWAALGGKAAYAKAPPDEAPIATSGRSCSTLLVLMVLLVVVLLLLLVVLVVLLLLLLVLVPLLVLRLVLLLVLLLTMLLLLLLVLLVLLCWFCCRCCCWCCC